jgi:hypothetical protein
VSASSPGGGGGGKQRHNYEFVPVSTSRNECVCEQPKVASHTNTPVLGTHTLVLTHMSQRGAPWYDNCSYRSSPYN